MIRPFLATLFLVSASFASAQTAKPVPPETLGLTQGTHEFDAGDYNVTLVDHSGVAIKLVPKNGGGFDFLPYDRLDKRNSDGFAHLGDIDFKYRQVGEVKWEVYSTFSTRGEATHYTKTKNPNSFAVYGLPGAGELEVTRHWKTENGRLQLQFSLTNRGGQPIEIGSLAMPMPFNNIISNRSLEEAHAKCSFTDPYIGEDAGYLRVTQLTGTGPTMVVTPLKNTPLEAWHLVNEPMRPSQTFEGMMEWMVHTKANAENEWKGVEQWNTPTEAILKPGQSRVYGFQFQPSPSIRKIEDTLAAAGRPVAVGLPGYVLPMDQDGKLFLKYGQPVKAIQSEPAGAIIWRTNHDSKTGWRGYTLRGKKWGRVRLTITYSDDTRQVVSYVVIKPAAEAVADLGHFLTTRSWFTDSKDPFGRAPSAITYDREANAQVTQDSRVWIAGLGDEAGSGSWLAAMMKNFGQPDAGEVHKLEQFVDGVLWGNLQFKDGQDKFGVRKSVFYYDPPLLPDFPYNPKFNWKSWTSWSKKTTDDIGRGYNYPHVVAAYWAMYRIARNHPGLVTSHPWSWYLDQAYSTTEFLTSRTSDGGDRVGYWRLGMMEGDVFVALLDDLEQEGWTEKAKLIKARMKERADRWSHEAYPFGSEMAWDSTGQEEVYAWCKYFGFDDKAEVSLNSILAYDPTVPHWGYNGNARRYWDFLYGGKLPRIERQLHHYGSGMNAIPLLAEYRSHPDDLYLLRVGYGGTMGALSNIDQEGFASAAFHSFPSTLKWDAYSGDYGPNFFGHAWNTGCYLVETKDFGWQAFGGNVTKSGDWVTVVPKDSFRSRFYLAATGTSFTLDSGSFQKVAYNSKTHRLHIVLGPGDKFTTSAHLTLKACVGEAGDIIWAYGKKVVRGPLSIPLSDKLTAIDLFD